MSDPALTSSVSDTQTLWLWLTPLIWLGGGLLGGVVVERGVMARLRAWAEKTTWQGDDIILAGLKGVPFFWCALIGLYWAVHTTSAFLAADTIVTLKSLVKVLWIVSFTVPLARIAGALVSFAARGVGGAFATSSIVVNLVRIAIVLVGLLVALESVGINITPIITALGVGGLAVALALQEPLSNLFAGLQLLAAKRVRLGDFVKLDNGDEGTVTDIAWRNTTITTLANNTVVIPNAKLVSAVVTNYHLPEPMMAFSVPVGVVYGSDLAKVERVALEVAKDVMATVQGGHSELEPAVRFTAFADSAITFNISMRVREFPAQFLMRHELIKRLYDRFNAEGIEFAYPTRTVIMKQG
jgi:small-conductance mechanosensitive channel